MENSGIKTLKVYTIKWMGHPRKILIKISQQELNLSKMLGMYFDLLPIFVHLKMLGTKIKLIIAK